MTRCEARKLFLIAGKTLALLLLPFSSIFSLDILDDIYLMCWVQRQYLNAMHDFSTLYGEKKSQRSDESTEERYGPGSGKDGNEKKYNILLQIDI